MSSSSLCIAYAGMDGYSVHTNFPSEVGTAVPPYLSGTGSQDPLGAQVLAVNRMVVAVLDAHSSMDFI